MKEMRSVRIKPNPAGKDRTRQGASVTQLGAEWVDLKNGGTAIVTLDGLSLYHVAYSGATDNGTWERVVGFRGQLGPGRVMRLHSGSGPVNALSQADLQGADVHVFTDINNYIWNNDRGDCAALQKDGEAEKFDLCWYDSVPPEGIVLLRANNKFVVLPSLLSAAGSRR